VALTAVLVTVAVSGLFVTVSAVVLTAAAHG
jgi:hypothetical protein